MFLFGIVVGAVALLEPIVLVAGTPSLARRRHDARTAPAPLQRAILVVNRRLDTRSSTNTGRTARAHRRPHEGATTASRKSTTASRVA